MSIADILPWIMSECGIDNSAPDITANTYEMRQIKSLMNAAGVDINTRVEWTGAFKGLTVAGDVMSVDLPDDFQEMAAAGAVMLDKTTYQPVRPVLDPTTWLFLRRTTASSQSYYHISAGSILFLPSLDSDGAIVRYISKNWLEDDKSEVTDNTDQPIFPDELLARAVIWRWRRQKGLAYDDHMAEFEADLEAAIKADRGAP